MQETIKCTWEISVPKPDMWLKSAYLSEDSSTVTESNTVTTGTVRTYTKSNESIFCSIAGKSGYLTLGKDAIQLIKCDPKRNSDASCQVFQALLLQQEAGWPTVEEVDADTTKETVEALVPGQLVRAMLRPGGHFYNGRITHSNEDGSMCGVKFFDGDEVDALPRDLITPIDSPKKIKPVVAKEDVKEDATKEDDTEAVTKEEVETAVVTLRQEPNNTINPSNPTNTTEEDNENTTFVDVPSPTPSPIRSTKKSSSSSTTATSPKTSPSGRPSTRRGRDETDTQMVANEDTVSSVSSRRERLPPRPSSARSARPNVFNNGTDGGDQMIPTPPPVPPPATASRGRTAEKSSTQSRKRPQSANPRGRSRSKNRKQEESFINRNKRLVSEMSRAIVRPSIPPPPPSEPDMSRTRRRRNNNSSSSNRIVSQDLPKWRATNRVWLNATGQGMSLWSNKVQSLNAHGASRHAGPGLQTATKLAASPVRGRGSPNRNSNHTTGGGTKKKHKPIRSTAELVASQEIAKIKGTSISYDLPTIGTSEIEKEDDRNAPYLLASLHRCVPANQNTETHFARGIQNDTEKKGGVSTEGVRVAQKRAALMIQMSSNKKKNKAGTDMEEWALRRSAEQRLSLKALTHLERSLNKVHTARRSLEQELNEIEGNSTAKNNRTEQQTSSFVNNKESATKTTETKTKTDRTTHSMYQPTMTVDDEVKTLARRSKMVVLRAAMTGTGTTSSGNAVENVDFDRYTTQLVMLTRRLRTCLHQQGSGSTFRWKWEDLERDLDTANKEEARALQHQAEKREKQRQRNQWRQQRYNDGSGEDPSSKQEQQGQQGQQGQGEPPRVAIHVPDDFRPHGDATPLEDTQVSFVQQSSSATERSNVSGPTLLRSLQHHCGSTLDLNEHEKALLLTHFEHAPMTLQSDGTIDREGEMRIDVQEFMDAIRPPLSYARQQIVDTIFDRFQETEEGSRIQKWRDAANSNASTQLISGTEVWTAYCAFRTLTPVGHRRGHIALESLDLWLRPVPENQAAEWLQASIRNPNSNNLLPSVARQPLRREQWDALHRALGARIPNDDIFERVVRATWVFAGQASIRSLAGGKKHRKRNEYNNDDEDEEGPFGVDAESVSTFITSGPAAVEESNKVWVMFGDRNDSEKEIGRVDEEERIYWYCAETGERTWRQPIGLKRQEEIEIKKQDSSRKRTAIGKLDEVIRHLEMDVNRWTNKLKEEGEGKQHIQKNTSSLNTRGVPSDIDIAASLCSSAVSLRGLELSFVPSLFVGEGGALGAGVSKEVATAAQGGGPNIVSHLWLDDNHFGNDETSVQSLGHLISRIQNSIVELSVCNNNLENMSSFDGHHFKCLHVLRLRKNKLRSWFQPHLFAQPNSPNSASHATLTDLDVSDNKLIDIPDHVLRSLPNLKFANFARNEMITLPSEPTGRNGDLPIWPSTLQYLDVSGNRLKKLPTSMGAASVSLTYLDASHNSIKTVSPTLFSTKNKSMSNLQHLYLQHNTLQGDDALPANMPMALSRSCRVLNVSHNSLVALPSALGNLFVLQELDASHNDLAAFPSGAATKTTDTGVVGGGQSSFLPQLKILKLESNHLSVLPNGFGRLLSLPTLQQVYLQNNSLVALPEMNENKRNPSKTGFIRGLLSLDVSNNKIVQLPRSIGEALGPTLLSLRISKNRLENFPIASFAKFKKLQELTCYGNQILSPDLQQVILTGEYIPPITRQVGHVVQKMFDAIKHNWQEVDTRVYAAVSKFRRGQTGRKNKRNRSKENVEGSETRETRQGKESRDIETAVDEARNGSALAQSTDDLLGSRRLFRSLNVQYQRLRECLRRFDSSGGARGGRLDAMEFRAAIESIGMYLSSEECDFLTRFSLETCGPTQRGSFGPVGNTGCVGINEFIAEVLRPGSTSSSKSEGVAQAVVRYCMDLSRRKLVARDKAYSNSNGNNRNNKSRTENSNSSNGNSHQNGASNGASNASRRRDLRSSLEEESREMRRELRSMKKGLEKEQHKGIEAEQFLEGRGPKPQWLKIEAPESNASKAGAKRYQEGGHKSREQTVFRAKIAHEKLRQKKRLMQQKIRQEAARVRRMEMKAAADPTLRRTIQEYDPAKTQQPHGGSATSAAIRRATNPNNIKHKGSKRNRNDVKNGQSVPLQLKSLIHSIKNGIKLDRRFKKLPPDDRANAFFDSIKLQEDQQGLVRISKSDDVAGGSLIAGLRMLGGGKKVLVQSEHAGPLLKVMGATLGGEGEVVDGQYDPVKANRVKRSKFLMLFGIRKKKQRPASSGQSRATNNPVAQHKRPTSAAAAKVSNDQARKKRSTKGPFALKVFFLGSSSAPCEIVVSSSDTLEVVKSKIEFQMGVPSERMHLFVGRRQVGNSSHGTKKGPTVGSVGLNPSNPELNVALS